MKHTRAAEGAAAAPGSAEVLASASHRRALPQRLSERTRSAGGGGALEGTPGAWSSGENATAAPEAHLRVAGRGRRARVPWVKGAPHRAPRQRQRALAPDGLGGEHDAEVRLGRMNKTLLEKLLPFQRKGVLRGLQQKGPSSPFAFC